MRAILPRPASREKIALPPMLTVRPRSSQDLLGIPCDMSKIWASSDPQPTPLSIPREFLASISVVPLHGTTAHPSAMAMQLRRAIMSGVPGCLRPTSGLIPPPKRWPRHGYCSVSLLKLGGWKFGGPPFRVWSSTPTGENMAVRPCIVSLPPRSTMTAIGVSDMRHQHSPHGALLR